MEHTPTITQKQGLFGGGAHPEVPVTVKILDFTIPKDHVVINGHLYRWIFDPDELQNIVFPDGSRPTACALVPV